MTNSEFFHLVRTMRQWQKAYFKSRGAAYPSAVTRDALDMSKRLEGQVDKALANGITPDQGGAEVQFTQQGDLF